MSFTLSFRSAKTRLERRPARAKSTRRLKQSKPSVELLEDRTVLSPYLVTTTADTGSGSLRDAINQINADTSHTAYPSSGDPSVDEIDFGITAASDAAGGGTGYNSATGVATIAPTSILPTIWSPVFINGHSQPGSSWNTLANDDNAVLRVVLNGRSMSVGGAGLIINSGNSIVRGLVINGFKNGTGISLQNAGGDRIQGNFIGTDASGTSAPYGLPNFASVANNSQDMGNGVDVEGSIGNLQDYIGTDSQPDSIDPLGWTDLAERNIIAANAEGIKLKSPAVSDVSQYQAGVNVVVAGNFIGTDVHGTTALGNWAGISLQSGTHDDRIGTDGNGVNDAGERNVISGNLVALVLNSPQGGVSCYRTVVAGNWIGTDANGGPMGNLWAGVALNQSAVGVRIGGPSTDQGNTIAYNGTNSASLQSEVPSRGTPLSQAPGVWIFTLGTSPQDITVQGNSIFGNAGLGIDLGGSYPPPLPDGVNDLGIPDGPGTGPNNLQHYPQLNAVQAGTTTSISGSLSSNNPGPFTLDFYANTNADPSGYGQGQTYLGSATIPTAGSFVVVLPAATTADEYISATATDAAGDTSEFSADQIAAASSQTASQFLQSAINTAPTASLTIPVTPSNADAVVQAIDGLGTQSTSDTVSLNLASGAYSPETVSVPQGMTLYINGAAGNQLPATVDPVTPAFILASGNVVISNVTFITTGDAPTILVTGGHLTLRNDVIQESTGFNDPAISITGGTVDLGTATDLGGNTFNINGTGTFVANSTGNPLAPVGDTFLVNGVPLAPDSLSGIVFRDFNDDGQVDFGEQGLGGVTVALSGTDFLGNSVRVQATTDTDGAYIFANLLPGAYSLTESQPAGYLQGINSIGTAGGALAATDQFFVRLAQDNSAVNGLNYNYGEQPAATGPVQKGQTAGIGFWNNKQGQALIKALPVVQNADGSVTSVANWLAATLPNLFGIYAGANNLTGKTNADVAALFQQDFLLKGVKLDAQVLATALSVYVTNATLDATGVAAQYGFTVSGDGVGTAAVNVGTSGDAFGVANNTTLTVIDLLCAADAQAVNGVLYGGNSAKRKEANDLFSAINQAGGI